jgi:hypothetical protein
VAVDDEMLAHLPMRARVPPDVDVASSAALVAHRDDAQRQGVPTQDAPVHRVTAQPEVSGDRHPDRRRVDQVPVDALVEARRVPVADDAKDRVAAVVVREQGRPDRNQVQGDEGDARQGASNRSPGRLEIGLQHHGRGDGIADPLSRLAAHARLH